MIDMIPVVRIAEIIIVDTIANAKESGTVTVNLLKGDRIGSTNGKKRKAAVDLINSY